MTPFLICIKRFITCLVEQQLLPYSRLKLQEEVGFTCTQCGTRRGLHEESELFTCLALPTSAELPLPTKSQVCSFTTTAGETELSRQTPKLVLDARLTEDR